MRSYGVLLAVVAGLLLAGPAIQAAEGMQDLELTEVTVSEGVIYPGDPVWVTIVVTNQGSVESSTFSVEGTVNELALKSDRVGYALAPGQSVELRKFFTAPPPPAVLDVRVEADTKDDPPGNNRDRRELTMAEGQPMLVVADSVRIDNRVNLIVRNDGDAPSCPDHEVFVLFDLSGNSRLFLGSLTTSTVFAPGEIKLVPTDLEGCFPYMQVKVGSIIPIVEGCEQAYHPDMGIFNLRDGSGCPDPKLVFYPTDDAWVNQDAPDMNYGSAHNLRVRPWGNNHGRHTYLKFMVAGIPAGKQVLAATLKIKAAATEVKDLTVYRVNTHLWYEDTITWNNASTDAVLLTIVPLVRANRWVSIDVTSVINGNGVYTIGLSSDWDLEGQELYSKESLFDPRLVVYHSP